MSNLELKLLTIFIKQLKHCVYHVRMQLLPRGYMHCSLKLLWKAKSGIKFCCTQQFQICVEARTQDYYFSQSDTLISVDQSEPVC